ncbi:MAG: 4Fe-4S binding protein [Candidatus Heteroscillospira sp.]|jgi:2-oxoglutarate ferredoxin oxidoreductase subunit delta
MSKITLKTENCKACGNCMRACKQDALTLSDEMNAKGYRVVAVEEEKCIGCGMCYTVCPDYVFSIAD